jgi:hypothetical protein
MTTRRPLLSGVAAVCCLGACGGSDPADAPVVGRYWAHVAGQGTTAGPTAVWFEYKPDSVPTWDFVPRTPDRAVDGGVDLSTIDAWIYGLSAGTSYSVRTCTREGCSEPVAFATKAPSALAWVQVDPNDSRHLRTALGVRWVPWGNNYVGVAGTSQPHQMVEDQMYDEAGLALIDADFRRLANVAPPDGAQNAIRMHVQLHTFLLDPTTPDPEALARFAHVIELAEDRGLQVMVTGLNLFYPGDNPPWVGQQTDEATHWATQATWWTAMASALHDSPGVFAYDLMNEPYVGGNLVNPDGVWWTNVAPNDYCTYGEDAATGTHGTCFGQFVTPDLGAREAADVAAAWTTQMVHAIRYAGPFENDRRHLVTIGVGAFGLSNVFNSSTAVHAQLDFLAPHLYPDADDNGQAAIDLAAGLAQLTTKPIIAGETFTFGNVRHLISVACNANTVQGWIGQYQGRILGDPCPDGVNPFGCALYDAWYEAQRDFGPAMRAGSCPPVQ